MPELLRFARRLTSSPHEAEDLLQDTAARAIQAADSFRGDASVKTWLHRIMWHLAIDRSRRSHRELVVEEVEERWRDDAYTVDPAVVSERAADVEELRDALIRLPFIYRSAVVLHDSLGWSSAEIAERLDISSANAKQRVHRGRMLLTTSLADGAERRHLTEGVTMHCWDAREMISDYLDGALAADHRERLETHLAHCPTCPPLYAALVDGTEALGALHRDDDKVVPPDLAQRIEVAITAAARQPTS